MDLVTSLLMMVHTSSHSMKLGKMAILITVYCILILVTRVSIMIKKFELLKNQSLFFHLECYLTSKAEMYTQPETNEKFSITKIKIRKIYGNKNFTDTFVSYTKIVVSYTFS